MIIKNITKKPISATATILSFKKGEVVPIKINKSIEIVIVPNLGDLNAHQDNVGIILEEEKILKILSKRYKNVSITKVNTEEDFEFFKRALSLMNFLSSICLIFVISFNTLLN